MCKLSCSAHWMGRCVDSCPRDHQHSWIQEAWSKILSHITHPCVTQTPTCTTTATYFCDFVKPNAASIISKNMKYRFLWCWECETEVVANETSWHVLRCTCCMHASSWWRECESLQELLWQQIFSLDWFESFLIGISRRHRANVVCKRTLTCLHCLQTFASKPSWLQLKELARVTQTHASIVSAPSCVDMVSISCAKKKITNHVARGCSSQNLRIPHTKTCCNLAWTRREHSVSIANLSETCSKHHISAYFSRKPLE
jgi:hypothetical protein